MHNLLLIIIKVLILLPNANYTKHVRDVRYPSSYKGNNALHYYVATSDDIPFHALIAYHLLYCSGALIMSKIVVTAASCFVKWQNHRIVVKVGSDTVTGFGQVIQAVELKKHEYFGHNSLIDNDIAMLVLKEHVFFNANVQKIILIEFDKSIEPGAVVDVSGYADQQVPKYANSLLWTEMTLLEDDECMKLYPGLMTHSNYCAKYAQGRPLSDNGGPAVFKDMLVGILSYGASNTEEPYVALLTNVSYFHKWISLNALRFMTKYCVPFTTPQENELDTDNYARFSRLLS